MSLSASRVPDDRLSVSMGDYEVELVRKRVKNLNLRVRRDGSVMASAPKGMPLAEVERFLRERDAWTRSQRKRMLATLPTARGWSDGEQVSLWGDALRLRVLVDANPKTQCAQLRDETLELHVTDAWADDGDAARSHRARLFDELLAIEMRKALTTLLPRCEERVGRQAGTICLRRMVSRWGSCNVGTGRIALNLELGERPPVCLEAVLCHELCHLHERRHNARFYEHLDRAFPDWREAHALLRQAPPRR